MPFYVVGKGDKPFSLLLLLCCLCQPYNFERLLYYLADENPTLVRGWMESVDATEKLDLDATWLSKLQRDFQSARVDDNEMCQTLRTVSDTYGYIADPHTGVALAAAEQLGYFNSSCVQQTWCAVLSTASPCKFEESMTAALGEEGWQKYLLSDFPTNAKAILEGGERPVADFRWKEGTDLKTVQAEWELKLRETIQKVET